jgi:hypothetical protein
MSPLLGRKKKPEEKTQKTEEAAETAEAAATTKEIPEKAPEEIQEKVTPLEWFKRLIESTEVQPELHSLPDMDIQLSIGDSLVRFVKKGLGKPLMTEERSLRPDAIIRISDKAWQQLSRKHVLDDLIVTYRGFCKSPTRDEFVKISINKEKLVSDSGILRSKLFKSLLSI